MQEKKQQQIEWALRLSTGIMYIYSGVDLFRHPSSWTWALPYWLRGIIGKVIEINLYIQIQGIIEIIFAVIFLLWIIPRPVVKWFALLSAVEFAAILVLGFMPWSATNFTTTFRDIGLLGGSLALYFLLVEKKDNGIISTNNQS